jgi:hypothetical protein
MKLVQLIKICVNAIYGKVDIGKEQYDVFPTQNGPRQFDVLSLLTSNFPLDTLSEMSKRSGRIGID